MAVFDITCVGPWLNNCIGHNNLPHFARFVMSVAVASNLCLILIGVRILDLVLYQQELQTFYTQGYSYDIKHYTPPMDDREVVFMLINLVLLFALLFTVGILSLWQLWYVSRNVTTIESFENGSIEDLIDRGKIPATKQYPYDLGWYRNLQMVFGERWYLWWMPQPAPGDGIHFERCNKQMWPPREYYLYKKYPYGKAHSRKSQRGKLASNVRLGDEGYEVRPLTQEDRERMLANDGNHYDEEDRMQDDDTLGEDVYGESSTDFDSLEEDEEEDTTADKGIPRVQPTHPLKSKQQTEDDSDDDEVLAVKYKKYLNASGNKGYSTLQHGKKD
jgi:uncharacterized membrane protein